MFEFEAIGFEKLSGPPKLDDSLPLIQTESNIKPTAVPDASYCYSIHNLQLIRISEFSQINQKYK